MLLDLVRVMLVLTKLPYEHDPEALGLPPEDKQVPGSGYAYRGQALVYDETSVVFPDQRGDDSAIRQQLGPVGAEGAGATAQSVKEPVHDATVG
jgi:hypothetical protein